MNPAILLLALVPQASKPDVAAEIAALRKEFSTAQQAFYAELHKKQEAGEKIGPADFAKRPGADFLPKFERLAERARGAPAELDALLQIAQIGGGLPDGAPKVAAAIAGAIERHIESPQLEPLVGMIGQLSAILGAAKAEASLRAVVAKSPHAEVRATAKMALASLLESAMDGAGPRKDEAKKLLEELAKEAGDTAAGKRAASKLFELANLQIGMTAPDIVAADMDGKDFKLSSFRGKVVVLDFWGFW